MKTAIRLFVLIVITAIINDLVNAQTPYDDFAPVKAKKEMLKLPKVTFMAYNTDTTNNIRFLELDKETLTLSYYDDNDSLLMQVFLKPTDIKWLSVDPMSNGRLNITPYHYCQNNPIMRIDPNGMWDSDHFDEYGNKITHYDDGDNSVYIHKYGTTKAQVDAQRIAANNTGGSGTKIGEIGGNIDVSTIMANKLTVSSIVAKGLGITGYFIAVKPDGIWDLKKNKSTIFGVAWAYDGDNGTKTTFSFGAYTNMSAADVGNFHEGYTGRYTYNSEGMSYDLLWRGAGAAETAKSITEFRLLDAIRQTSEIFGNGIVPSLPPYGDRVSDFIWNTSGMIDADKNKK